MRIRATKTLFLSILLSMLSAFLGSSAYGMTQNQKLELQSQIEKEINVFLGNQLRSGEYFVYALVSSANDGQSKNEEGSAKLPYSPVRVSPGVLKNILNRTLQGDELDQVNVIVTITFDERIPEAKRKLVETIVRERFGFDGTKRILNVTATVLITQAIGGQEKLDIEKAQMDSEKAKMGAEKARLETEQAKLRLEMERTKLEFERKQLEIAKQQSEMQTKVPAIINKTNPAVGTKSAETDPAVPAEPEIPKGPAYTLLQDFQIGLVAIVFGLMFVIVVMVGGTMFKSSVLPMSGALESVGNSIETAAKSMAPSQTSVSVSSDDESGRSTGRAGEEGAMMAPGIIGGVASQGSLEFEEFVKQVQEKIEVLSREKNFSFFRALGDMIDNKKSISLAAAVMVSFDNQTTKDIIEDLSIDQIAKIKGFLASEGGLSKAKEMRGQALSAFYGRIAMDEFVDSPLMQIKDLNWLTKMTSSEMASFTASLPEVERPVFLACLTAERVKLLLSAMTSEEDKEKIFKAISQIDQVTEDRINPVMTEISKRMATAVRDKKGATRFAVDGARYLADIAADLSENEQKSLFRMLNGKAQLLKGIQQHFIPFNSVTRLPKDLIIEIFNEQPDQRIAQIVFDSPEEVRNKIVSSLPEIRAESVKDELRALDNDVFYAKRHRSTSSKLQKEISIYLLKLHSEGLLKLEDAEESAVGGLTANNNAA